MKLRTPLLAWRTTFFATLGLSPLVACSSSDASSTGAGGTGGAAASGGSTSTGGASGSAGNTATGGAGGKGGTNGGSGGASTGGASTGGASGSAGKAATGGGGVTGGGGSGGNRGGADAGPDAADAGRLSCVDPAPRLGPDGKPTGIVDCANGVVHRPEKHTCATASPRTAECMGGAAPGTCTHDSDCTAQSHGYCELSNGPMGSTCACNYGCTTDAECGAGALCGCGDLAGGCIGTQNCASDADCGPGLLCILTSDGGCGMTFACQTPKDTCASSYGCDATELCAFVTDHHECAPHRPCSTGRPFLVEGRARVASLMNQPAWASSLSPCLDGLDASARRALSEHWTQVALMEHASIAAFARFALELLSLGAPPELLGATHAALADETAHARDAFALASTYAGGAVGPGPLSMRGVTEARSISDIIETTVLEGCIGETVAALEAAEALAHATDPAVVAALSKVARDETRHAELAYRFVRWALETSPRAAREVLSRRVLDLVGAEQADRQGEPPHGKDAAALLARHGLLPEHMRAALRRRALSEVVAPCLNALVGVVAGATTPRTGEREQSLTNGLDA